MKNIKRDSLFIFFAGVLSAAMQCICIRECFSVFSGNEMVLGVILAVWLMAAGLGSIWGVKRIAVQKHSFLALVFLASSIWALIAIRLSVLFFEPGEAIPPFSILLICIISESPFAFLCGVVYAICSRRVESASHIFYIFENLGNALGALVTTIGVICFLSNGVIVVIASIPLFLFCIKKPLYGIFFLCGLIALALADRPTAMAKYPKATYKISYGHHGEVVKISSGLDTTWLLNRKIYRSTAELGYQEQAVHIPLSYAYELQNVLVIFDRGHLRQLRKYPNIHYDCVEQEPLVASKASIVTSIEIYRPNYSYDIVLLGSDLPTDVSSNRFFTITFFRHIRKLMKPEGIFSFTLSLNRNYMTENERWIFDCMKNTLLEVFKNVVVFAGEGFTFVASDRPLSTAIPQLKVPTEYLQSRILADITEQQIKRANEPTIHRTINTISRPIVLVHSLNRWIHMHSISSAAFFIIVGIFFAGAVAVLPKRRSILSIATSGFVAGIFSVGLMMLYQATYGTLYANVSVLLIALTLGFAVGAKVPHLPCSDILIGIYSVSALVVMSRWPYLPTSLFFVLHAGMGILAGAQFATQSGFAGHRYGADLIGGVFGMVLGSTLLLPLVGIEGIAILCGILKFTTAAIVSFKSNLGTS